MTEQRLNDYLLHIVAAIERIVGYTGSSDNASFLADERTQDAVIRNLEIIGEASHRIETRFPES
ncbi:HepT-like ribonuclease domain-containing protein [Gryllotalpicola koreensis]|uniref:DUF86 domain-containing protein n=1 Tax=Gryllotalpicola koreensis TaxID=993086 RepID=A0ABP8A0V6_9MICO